MQIIKIIVAILLYGYGVLFFAAMQLDIIRDTGLVKNTDKRIIFSIYSMAAVDVIAATLLLRA